MVRRWSPGASSRTAIAALLVVLVVLVADCGGDDGATAPATGASPQAPTASTSTQGTVPSPPGDLYKSPDPLEPAPPGTLIWAEKVDLGTQPPATVWRILYHSRSRDDRDIAVSGFAVVPTASIPDSGRRVFAWAHGTVGLGDQCAPSRDIRENFPPFGGEHSALAQGAVLVATDYEGLGTPGVPTSTVALAEGHAVLDSVRAAAALPNASVLGDVVLAGHSQGGQAVLSAAEIAPEYAPELHLVGVVALAAGVELPALVDHLVASPPGTGVALIGAIGLRAGYPDLDLSTVFTPSAIADIDRVETECVDDTVARYQSLTTSDVIRRCPGAQPDLQALLEQNSPGAVPPMAPVFIGHGASDEQVPPELSAELEDKYCALGAKVTRRVYPGQDHVGVIDAASDDVITFTTDRYEHRPATSTCRST